MTRTNASDLAGFRRLVDRAAEAVLWGSSLLVGGIVLAVTYMVLARATAGRPPLIIFELIEYAIFWAALLALPALVRDDGNVRMDLIDEFVSARVASRLQRVADGIVLVVVGGLLTAGFFVTWLSHGTGIMTTGVVGAPRWIVLIAYPATMAVVLLVQMRRVARPRQSTTSDTWDA